MLVKVTLLTVRNLRAAIYLLQRQIYSSPENNDHCEFKVPVSKKNKSKGRDDGARDTRRDSNSTLSLCNKKQIKKVRDAVLTRRATCFFIVVLLRR